MLRIAPRLLSAPAPPRLLPQDGGAGFADRVGTAADQPPDPLSIAASLTTSLDALATERMQVFARGFLAAEGRPEEVPGTAFATVDADPDPGPPVQGPPDPVPAPTENGRAPDSQPGAPADTAPSPAPGGDPRDYGRPPGSEPALPQDPAPLDFYTGGGPAAVSFNVAIAFEGSWTPSLQTAFIAAAEYLGRLILADLPDAVVDNVAVDDIRITATLEPVDGPGGVLGSAGPRVLRGDGTALPILGAMTFDSADAQLQAQNGGWDTIVLHEMMHALGFGTLWSFMGLATGSVAGGDIRFTGPMATARYGAEFPFAAAGDPEAALGVPLETGGGPGTAGGHWDEFVFGAEIMTGFIDPGAFVSEMTIAALEDMGYDTVLDDPASATDRTAPIPADPLLDVIA